MSTELIIAAAIAVPIILFPAAFIWYINFTGYKAIWKANRARANRQEESRQEAPVEVDIQ